MKSRGRAGPVVAIVLLCVTAAAGVGIGTLGIATAATPHSEGSATADPGEAVTTAGPHAHQAGHVNVTQELRRSQSSPGTVQVERTYHVTNDIFAMTTTVPEGASSVSYDDFTQVGDREYRWEEDTNAPTLSFRLPVNETGTASGPMDAGGNLRFADTGEWGLIRIPTVDLDPSSTTGDVTTSRHDSVFGPGTTGEEIAYLGQHEEHRLRANGQTFRLIEPAAANLTADPDDVLRSLSGAASGLDVGSADEGVFVVAAPESVGWAGIGEQVGAADMYVSAGEPVSHPRNTWLHQYVHTRQTFEPTEETRWLTEASAHYYAALLTLQQGRINVTEFRDWLGTGSQNQYTDVELRDPASWHDDADFWKGGLALGQLDLQTRQATSGRASLTDVFSDLNGVTGQLPHAALLDAVEQHSGVDVRTQAKLYTESTNTPAVWGQSTHEAAFGTEGGEFTYDIPDVGSEGAYQVRGPYRNGSIETEQFRLVVGERLAFNVTVENVGHRAGTYTLEVLENGAAQLTREGDLIPGERASEPVELQFNRTGERGIRIGEAGFDVQVSEPAVPVVTNLTANRTSVEAGEPVGLTAEIENRADRPAGGTINATSGGDTAASRPVSLDVDDGTAITLVVNPSAGSTEYSVGNRSVSIEATDPTAEDGGGSSDGTLGPGFGLVAAVLALALAALLARRR